MTQKKSFSKSLALSLALILVLPMIALIVSACGSKTYHKVTFYDEDKETILQYVKVEDGKTAKYTAELPTKAGDQTYRFVFKNWVDENGVLADLTDIQEDKSVYASYRQEYVEYTLTKPAQVTVRKGGSALANGDTLHYGDEIVITYTETAGKHMTAFKLNGDNIKNGTLYMVKGNVEIVYQEMGEGATPTPSTKYTVKFLGPTGAVVASQDVEKNGKATMPDYNSSEYKLLNWDFDFDAVVEQDTTVKGYFVKNSEIVEGAEFIVSGELQNTVLSISVSKTSDLYKILQSQFGDGAEIPTSFDLMVTNADSTISNNDRIEWGEISYKIDLGNESLNLGFWAGYFEGANVLSINIAGLGTDYDNIYLTQDSSGACGVYKNVYGIVGPKKIEGLDQDKIEGASVVANFEDLNSIGSVLTLNLEKGSVMYNIASKEFGTNELPTSIELTISSARSGIDIEEWEKRNYGKVDYVVTFKNEVLNIEFDFGCYTWIGHNHILVINSSSLGLGVSNVFILIRQGATEHYAYTALTNFDLIEEMATIKYIGMNGQVLETRTSRVGAWAPTLNRASEVSGFRLIGWKSTHTNESGNELLVYGTNNLYGLYVKENENDGVKLTIVGQSEYWVNQGDKITCEMSTESVIYQYLSEAYGNSVPTTLTWVVTRNEWDSNEKCDRFYITIEGMDGVSEYVRYFSNQNIIAMRIFSTSNQYLGSRYFVSDENRFGNGVVFNCYSKVYSYNNIFNV